MTGPMFVGNERCDRCGNVHSPGYDLCPKPKAPQLIGHIASSTKREDLPEYRDGYCPVCARPLDTGFGLAGGGYGVYTYCEEHGVTSKTEVEE